MTRPAAGRLTAVGAICLLLAFGGWALSSPVGSSPDEDFHLASIWCAWGERTGLCEPGDTSTTRRVPAQFPSTVHCYAFDPEQSAACQPDLTVGPLVETDRGNFAGPHPPVYYWFAGLFASHSIAGTVLVLRVLNAALYLGLLTAVYLLVSPGLRRAMVLGALVTAVPLGLFVVGSVNPSAWALISAATLLVSVVGYLTTEDRRRRIALGVIAAISLVMAAGAQADAAAYSVIAIAVALILTWRRRDNPWTRLAYPVVLAVAGGAAFLLAGQSSVADPDGTTQPVSFARFVRVVIDIPALWSGAMGGPHPKHDLGENGPWGLGWLDTAVPAVVWVGVWGIFCAVLSLAMAHAQRRRILAVTLVGLAVLLIPTYLQVVSGSPVGSLVQPRSVLPLLTLLVITALIRLDGQAFRLNRAQRVIVVAVLAIGNAAALYANLRRYVTGNDVLSWNLDRDVEWWWSIPLSPLALWLLTVAAFGVGAVLVTSELATDAAADDAPVWPTKPRAGQPASRPETPTTAAPTTGAPSSATG
jgi:hypothetical protein